VDVTGWRKPISHYREMLWTDDAPLYMAVKEPNGYHGDIKETAWSVWPTWESWTWKGWEGKPVEVEVYTKLPEVRLYLNDQLIGTKQVSRETKYKAVFTVPYQPGTLRAVADNQSVSLSTAGEPAFLRLTPDHTVMAADGQSLTFVIAEVLDSDGRVVPEAAIPCEATVKGAGTLLAFASADLKDREPTVTPKATTWKGRAMLVIRSTKKQGSVKLTVKSPLPTVTLTLKTR
jgi:beta-galactosidase